MVPRRIAYHIKDVLKHRDADFFIVLWVSRALLYVKDSRYVFAKSHTLILINQYYSLGVSLLKCFIGLNEIKKDFKNKKLTHFLQGAMRTAHHMKDLSMHGDESRFVLKLSKDPAEDSQIYYDDVAMQMDAKMYAEEYNKRKPPKRVDFLAAYVLQVVHSYLTLP